MIAGWAFSVRIKIGFGAFPHQPRQTLGERVIHLFECQPRRSKSFGHRLAHADGLTALPWKNECSHLVLRWSPLNPGSVQRKMQQG